jgi:hypothetical protein
MANDPQPQKRPGPFAQDLSREPPSKQQRDKDYLPEKKEAGEAAKKPAKPKHTAHRA